MTKVLEGVRVLEHGTFITGPAASMLLALMRGERDVPHNVDVGYELVVRGST